MVDIIKSLPPLPTSFASNTHNSFRYNSSSQHLNLPVFLSHVQKFPQNDRINNIHTKRWMGHCPTNPPGLLDVSNTPYSLHRKVMFQELSRHNPTIVDLNGPLKNKQQQRNTNKDPAKTKITTTTTTTEETDHPTQSFSNVGDARSSRLFDTLSKHFTIKAEPLRPSNSFTNSTTTTLTSWQRYWASTHVQRRRKEVNEPEPEPVLYRPKREQSIPGQTHFVVLRDSPYPNREHHTDSRTPSTPPSSCSPTKLSVSTAYDQPIPTTSNKQISTTKEDDDVKKETNRVSLIEFVASSLIPSTVVSLQTTEKDDVTYFAEKSLLLSLSSSSSSAFKSDSQIIDEVADAQNELVPLTTKVYNLSLPPDPPKIKRRSSPRRRTRSKSKEKKGSRRTPSASKQKRQSSANQNKPKQSSLTSLMTTTSISKYSRTKWDEPYIGVRFDPPTPPCSPSLFQWPQDSDDNDTLVTSEIYAPSSTTKVLESCAF